MICVLRGESSKGLQLVMLEVPTAQTKPPTNQPCCYRMPPNSTKPMNYVCHV